MPTTATTNAATTTRTKNVDTVRAAYAAFARGDLATVLAALDPEISWQTPATLPWSDGDYHGPDGVAAYFTSFAATLTDPAVAPEEFLDAGEHIVVHGHEHGTATTGRRFAARFTHTWTLRDGKVTRLRGVVDTAAIRACFADADSDPHEARP